MNTKTCKKCGWVFPATQYGNKCPFCGEKFDVVVCYKCKRVVSGADKVPGRALCKECHNADEREHMQTYHMRRMAKLEEKFEEWLDKVHSVPENYPTLTEEQWLEACRYFDGCARCHSKDIDTRGFFIGFDIGGRYCDWNIIPLCDKCAGAWQLDKNPFRTAGDHDKKRQSGYEHRDSLDNIVKYLGGKLDAACRNLQTDATGCK